MWGQGLGQQTLWSQSLLFMSSLFPPFIYQGKNARNQLLQSSISQSWSMSNWHQIPTFMWILSLPKMSFEWYGTQIGDESRRNWRNEGKGQRSQIDGNLFRKITQNWIPDSSGKSSGQSVVRNYISTSNLSNTKNFLSASSSCSRLYIFKILVLSQFSQFCVIITLDFQDYKIFKILRFSKFLDFQAFLSSARAYSLKSFKLFLL